MNSRINTVAEAIMGFKIEMQKIGLNIEISSLSCSRNTYYDLKNRPCNIQIHDKR